ncbi:MAG: acyl-CoA dehydrogenase family protein [Hyphomonas sp.]
MSALFSEEQLMIRDMARKFAEDALLPHSDEWDQNSHFPVDVIRSAAELGFASIYVKEDVGGAGLTRTDAAMIFEQLAYGDVSTAAFLSIHNMASWMIDTFGSEAQRKAWLPKLTSMELIASYCLTEPGAGSDAASLKTKAVREGDEYVITGTKQFISGAGTSDIYVLMARTSEDGAKGVSTFIIPKDTPGLSFGANERKMGWKSQPTRQVILDGVRVPAANRVGEEGHGFKFAMAGLDGGRLNIAACALGGAQLAPTRHSPMRRSAASSARRLRISRRHSSSWPTWRPSCRPRA